MTFHPLQNPESQMPTDVMTPAGYTPTFAVSFSDGATGAQIVANASPLPVTTVVANKPAALGGTTSASATFGPFVPVAGQPVVISLSGTWSGTVSLLRSVDGGTTRLPVTIGGRSWGQYSSNVCEPVWEEAEASAALYLAVALQSGTVTYRLAQ